MRRTWISKAYCSGSAALPTEQSALLWITSNKISNNPQKILSQSKSYHFLIKFEVKFARRSQGSYVYHLFFSYLLCNSSAG